MLMTQNNFHLSFLAHEPRGKKPVSCPHSVSFIYSGMLVRVMCMKLSQSQCLLLLAYFTHLIVLIITENNTEDFQANMCHSFFVQPCIVNS